MVANVAGKDESVHVVEIYVKTTCPYCWRAKHLLQTKGVEFREIVVDFGGPVREEMIRRANGRTTVPQIFRLHDGSER